MRKILLRIDRGIEIVENLVSATALAAIVTLVCAQVFYRYILYSGIIWGDEMVALLMVLMVMFGAARGMRDGEHTDMQSLINALPRAPRTVARVLTAAATLLFLVIFLISSWQYTLGAAHLKTIMLKMPLWLCYGLMPVGALLMTYEFAKRLRIWVFNDPDQTVSDKS